MKNGRKYKLCIEIEFDEVDDVFSALEGFIEDNSNETLDDDLPSPGGELTGETFDQEGDVNGKFTITAKGLSTPWKAITFSSTTSGPCLHLACPRCSGRGWERRK